VPTQDAVLARLTHEGRPLAVIQGYRAGNKFDYYLAGTALDSPHSPIKSPGIAAHLRLKSYLFDSRRDALRLSARVCPKQGAVHDRRASDLSSRRRTKRIEKTGHQLTHFGVRGARAIKRIARGQ
jgi:hypothetical protein